MLNHKGHVQLLYSAWSRDEFIFKVRVWNPTFFFSALLEQSVCVYVTVTRFYSLSPQLTQDCIDSIVAQSNKLVRAKYFGTKEKIGNCDVEGKSLKYVLKLKVG